MPTLEQKRLETARIAEEADERVERAVADAKRKVASARDADDGYVADAGKVRRVRYKAGLHSNRDPHGDGRDEL